MTKQLCETNCKLSDRITNSVKKLLKYHQNHSYFGQILLTGEDDNATQVIKQMWRNLCAVRDWWYALLDSALQKADTEADKRVIEEIIRETRLYVKRRENRFTQKFGAISDSLWCNLLPQSFWLFTQYLTKEAQFGSLNELITTSFAFLLIRVENQKLKTHPNFKPNPYYDFCCGDDLRFLFNAHKLLLDSKENISEDEEKHLVELVKKTIAFRHICCSKSQVKNKSFLNLVAA